jgi:hypothetical protein
MSAPHFTPEEVVLINTTVVARPIVKKAPEFEALERQNDTDTEIKEIAVPETMTIEEAIQICFRPFFNKRKASGDARPCGPHDMLPVYTEVFKITIEELKDEKFLSRLGRSGLGRPKEKAVNEGSSSNQKEKGGKGG